MKQTVYADSDFFRFPGFGTKRRIDSCSLCHAETGDIVGRLTYASLGEWDVVQCPRCGLISFDEMPDTDIIREGGERLYLMHQSSHSRKRFLRFFSRTYRRGGHFAQRYLKRFYDRDSLSILECGADNGYFSQGVRKIFPNAEVHYLDIVEDLKTYYYEHFVCEAVAGEFSGELFPTEKFDLVIARDILEHVRDPMKFLRDANQVLCPGGYFFFITPNGLEDFWLCSQRYKYNKEATLIWQNHFHYYLPQTLDRMLDSAGFAKQIAFKWGLRHHRKGLGHKEMPDLPAQEFPELSGEVPSEKPSDKWRHATTEVTGSVMHNLGPISRLYSLLHDRQNQRCDYYDSKGHEFFVIARKVMS